MNTLILDANNLLYRTFWVNKHHINDDDATSLMFIRAVKSYCEKFNPDRTYAVWDKKLTYPSTNFRKNISSGTYKSNRDNTVAKEAHKNDDSLKELLEHLGIKSLYPNVMEADDVIAYLCHNLTGKKYVVTVDKDLYQLINDETYIYNPIQKITVTPDNFTTYTKGVELTWFLDYKALVGDNSDNIKGLHKVGHKRAITLIEKFKKAEAAEVLNEHQYQIYKGNKDMMDLSMGYTFYEEEVPTYQKQLEEGMPEKNMDAFFEKCKELNLNSIVNQKDKWCTTFNFNESLVATINKLNTSI